MTTKQKVVALIGVISLSMPSTALCGKIVYPWRAASALAKVGETFEVWFAADGGQTVNSVTLRGPYNTLNNVSFTQTSGTVTYDHLSGNTYNTKLVVTAPSNATEDRYTIILNTSSGTVTSERSVRIVRAFKDEYYVIHHSDLHMMENVTQNLRNLTAVVDMANIMDVEVVIATGDNQQGHNERRDDANPFNLWYYGTSGLKGVLDFNAATMDSAGNHDWSGTSGVGYDGGGVSKATWYNQYAGLTHQFLAYGNARYMTYNSGFQSVSATANGQNWYDYQLSQLGSWLDKVGAGNLRAIGTHRLHDPQNKLGSFVNANNRDVDLGFHGHDHTDDLLSPRTSSNMRNGHGARMMGRATRPAFNLFKINNLTGAWEWIYDANPVLGPDNATSDYNQGFADHHFPGSAPPRQSTVAVSNYTADYSVWNHKLTLTYANGNSGVTLSETADAENNFHFPSTKAKARFLMPKEPAVLFGSGPGPSLIRLMAIIITLWM